MRYEQLWPISEAAIAQRFPEHTLELSGFPSWDLFLPIIDFFVEYCKPMMSSIHFFWSCA